MRPLHINDEEARSSIKQAASAACRVLDETFPGKDGANPGITSNFQGLLVEVLEKMLEGSDPLSCIRGHITQLPQLVLTDSSFGDRRQQGDGYVIVKRIPKPGTYSSVITPYPSLNDPYTSFEAAVQGAMHLLKRSDDPELALEVKPVFMTDTGFSLEPPHQAAA